MRSFSFSMQRLLDARDALEKAAAVRVHSAQVMLDRGEERLSVLILHAKNQMGNAEKLQHGNARPRELIERNLFITRMEKQIEKQAEIVSKFRASLQEAQGELLMAVRERKILENLKGREKKEWALDNRRMERKENDEIATTRFLRQEKIA